MDKQLNLESAVRQVYGSSFKTHSDNIANWSQFTPFRHRQSNKIKYFKLLRYPAQFQTSQQIVHKSKQKISEISHNVNIFELSREMNARIYLLKAESNIIILRSYCLLKRSTRQNIQSDIVLKILQFLASIAPNNYITNEVSLDNIGIDSEGKLKLLDYSYYFRPIKQCPKTKKQQFRQLLSQLFSPGNKQRDTKQVLKIYEAAYGKEISNIVHSLIDQQGEDLILEKVQSLRMSSTQDGDNLTQSQQNGDQALAQATLFYATSFTNKSEASDLKLDLIFKPTNKKNKTKICKISVLIFTLLVVGAALLIYQLILYPRPIQCEVGQYQDTNKKCRECTIGCLKCENELADNCYACKESMFLILCDSQKQVGKCLSQCKGTLIRGNICVDPT